MPFNLSWEQIALRILLATIASLLIGLNRDEKGHPAGMRTTLLVCLAACLAQLQANLLLPTAGKTMSSFSVLDLERLPLGILSGIGFIGAGVIVKRGNDTVSGVTTAATIWFVTVLGLLFGGGQLRLGSCATAMGVAILWCLKWVENRIPRQETASLWLTLDDGAPDESEIRALILKAGCRFTEWKPTYDPPSRLSFLECKLEWRERPARELDTPEAIQRLRTVPGVRSLTWRH
ncbi:MAG TPA: MgtC/SapB family protein [Candidatus Aquilonibacter sp.]|nr:MgtC/SapB family protein [Candidatus Aquilonibacter sp.]